MAKVTGDDWSRVAKVLKILDLPAPLLDFLRTHDTPEITAAFTERQLRELLALKDPRAMWARFQKILAGLGYSTDKKAGQGS